MNWSLTGFACLNYCLESANNYYSTVVPFFTDHFDKGPPSVMTFCFLYRPNFLLYERLYNLWAVCFPDLWVHTHFSQDLFSQIPVSQDLRLSRWNRTYAFQYLYLVGLVFQICVFPRPSTNKLYLKNPFCGLKNIMQRYCMFVFAKTCAFHCLCFWGPSFSMIKRLNHCETSESYYCHRSFRNMPHRRTRDTEPIDRMLLLLPDKAVLANLLESAQLQFKQHGYAGRHWRPQRFVFCSHDWHVLR